MAHASARSSRFRGCRCFLRTYEARVCAFPFRSFRKPPLDASSYPTLISMVGLKSYRSRNRYASLAPSLEDIRCMACFSVSLGFFCPGRFLCSRRTFRCLGVRVPALSLYSQRPRSTSKHPLETILPFLHVELLLGVFHITPSIVENPFASLALHN